MDDLTKILTQIQTDLAVIKTTQEHTLAFMKETKVEHKILETKVQQLDKMLSSHINKVKGFGILLGICGSVWTLMRIVQI